MKLKTKNIWLYIILFIVIIHIIYVTYIAYNAYNQTKIEAFREPSTIEMVVSRYNEKLEWLNADPYNKFPVVIYNKGTNDDFAHTENVKDIIKLPNVGREGHTYLYHIINNYDNLCDMTIFLPGSADATRKSILSSNLLHNITKQNKNIYTCARSNLYETEKNFTIDSWLSTDIANQKINSDANLSLSNIRPFGKWYNYYFGTADSTDCISYAAIFAISKENILKKPKEYYMQFMDQLSQHHNPEVGHYIERSWAQIFPQDDNTMYLYIFK